MVFSSIIFLCAFLPIVCIGYFLLPKRLRNMWLLLLSLLFYAWGEPIFVLLLIISSFINYLCGIIIEKTKYKKLILIICLIINISLLVYFKYINFLIDNLNLFGLSIENLDVVLPLGISFFTFQAISYVVDVYRNNVKAEYNFFTKNAGELKAYLKSVTFANISGESVAKKCVAKTVTAPKTPATQSLVDRACQGITLTVTVGSEAFTGSTLRNAFASETAHDLAKAGSEPVKVTIAYEAGSEQADGGFDVSFGDVTLLYSSVV